MADPNFNSINRPQNKRRSRKAVWQADTARPRSVNRAFARALKPRAHKRSDVADHNAARKASWEEHFKAGGTVRDGVPTSREEHNPPAWDPFHVALEDYRVWYDSRGRAAVRLNVARCDAEEVALVEAKAERDNLMELDSYVETYGKLPAGALKCEPSRARAAFAELEGVA